MLHTSPVHAVFGLALVMCCVLAGDAAALDTDADGVPDDSDNCVYRANADQADGDHDGIGDVCYLCGLLGEAAGWGVTSAGPWTARARGGDHVYSGVDWPSCAAAAYVADIDLYDDLVVLATKSPAVRFSPLYRNQFGEVYDQYRVDGDIVTGGGSVRGCSSSSPDSRGPT
jgi:hypothetical protein